MGCCGWSRCQGFLLLVYMSALVSAEMLWLLSYFVDFREARFRLATELSNFLILISLILIYVPLHVAKRFVSEIRALVIVRREGIGARLPHT